VNGQGQLDSGAFDEGNVAIEGSSVRVSGRPLRWGHKIAKPPTFGFLFPKVDGFVGV
jgi:hypothetical protein